MAAADDDQHGRPAEAVDHAADESRGDHACQVHAEDQPDYGAGQGETRSEQPVAEEVVDRHEAAHQKEARGEQPEQPDVGERATDGGDEFADPRRPRLEARRRHDGDAKGDGAQQRYQRGRTESPSPARDVVDQCADQSAGHATQSGARDVQAHRRAE